MTRVLVVDDEPPIVRAVAANLRVRGFEVLTASTGEAALAAVETHQPDCVVLDLGLPGIDGLEVLRRLRTWTQVPVVVLTAIDSERDKVTALDLGADDYVTKPFGVAELMARVRVALRHARAAGADRPRVITAGEVSIDLDAKLVTRDGAQVRLTPTEYRLVETLATSLASRSMLRPPVRITRGRSALAPLPCRSATRIRAISSATPNGLVT